MHGIVLGEASAVGKVWFNHRVVTLVMRGFFGMETKLHKAAPEAAVQFTLQPQYTDNPQNIYKGVITNALQNCRKELPWS